MKPPRRSPAIAAPFAAPGGDLEAAADQPHFPRRGKKISTLWKITWMLGWGLAAAVRAESPFAVAAERSEWEGRSAVRVAITVPEDHHLYANFTVADPAGRELTPLHRPEPDSADPTGGEPSFSTTVEAFYEAPASDTIVVTYQGCRGNLCFLPEEITLSIGPPDASGSTAEPAENHPRPFPLADRGAPRRLVGYADVPTFLAFLDPQAAPPPAPSLWRLFLDDPGQFYLRHGIWPALLLILLGGFLLNLTPCVLPMIPVNLAIIGATAADAGRAARFGLGGLYGLGMALVYGALGLAVVLTGRVFGAIHASPIFHGVIALIFFLLALALFDVWQLDFSRFRKPTFLSGRLRLPAVLGLGGLSALLAGACVAPVLVAVLALAGSLYARGILWALALPFLLGVGMALPWPLAAAGFAILPKPGAWMGTVKKAFGIVILLIGFYYALQAFHALRRASAAPATTINEAFRRFDFGVDSPEKFDALLEEAAASGKPVLLDFGAHWCKVCKQMDATTLQAEAVREKLREFFALQILADQPNRAPARERLAPFALQGYPTYLLYPPPQEEEGAGAEP